MTDPANPGAAPAVTPADANASPGNNGSPPGDAPDIFAGLQNAESRQWVESKGYRALDPLVESARHADKVQAEYNEFKAKALAPPANDAPKEQWDAFYAKLGRPEKAEAYEFKMPEGLPEGFAYDGESAKAYQGWAHEAGLNPRQAQALHDRFVQYQAGQQTAYAQSIVQKGETAQGELVKVWGDKASEGYKQNVQFADRFIRHNGGEALLGEMKANGLLDPDGFVLSPVLAQAMAKAGKALYAEDQFATGGAAAQPKSAAETLYPVDPFKR
ncbi:hypothetical protein ACN6KF_003048 [Labrys sp. La1]|uniref:hypothetical protein n=1 Tax=Labrys sp. La1 TaxID=3404917 RepID=UPI003EB80D47